MSDAGPGARAPDDGYTEGPFRHGLEALPRQRLADGRTLIEHTVVGEVTYWWFFDVEYRHMVRRMAAQGRKGLGTAQGGWRARLRMHPAVPWAYRALAATARRRARRTLARAGHPVTPGADGCAALFTAQNRMWRAAQGPDGSTRRQDVFWAPVVEALSARGVGPLWSTYPTEGTSWPWPVGPGARIIREKARTPHGLHHVPTDVFWHPKVWKEELRHRRILGAAWQRLGSDPVLQELLAAHGASGEGAREELEYAFTVLMPRMAGMVALMRRTIAAVRPEVVVMLNEFGRLQRALVYAARLRGIPVVAMQHGVIHPDHPGYIFGPDEVHPEGGITPPHVPIPDEMAVYGAYHKELLLDAGYPDPAVVITGHPRADRLHEAPRLYDREKILRGHGLDPALPTVLWPTQTHGLPEEENIAYRDAMRALVGSAERRLQVLIKLHPGEDPKATFYRDAFDLKAPRGTDDTQDADLVARSGTLDVAVAGPDADIYGAIYATDLVVTRHSTTAMEAVALERPVVVLNLSGKPDPVDYVEQGVARGVYRPEDLTPAVLALLEDDTEQARHRPAYVARYLHSVDGRSVDRLAERILAHL